MFYFLYAVIPTLLELIIALLFKFKGKKLYLYIAGVNIVTQSLICLLLPIFYGSLILLFVIPVAAIIFFILEMILHSVFIPKISDGVSKSYAFLYAIVANIVTIVVEVIIAILLYLIV